jgi:hypothetical protein
MAPSSEPKSRSLVSSAYLRIERAPRPVAGFCKRGNSTFWLWRVRQHDNRLSSHNSVPIQSTAENHSNTALEQQKPRDLTHSLDKSPAAFWSRKESMRESVPESARPCATGWLWKSSCGGQALNINISSHSQRLDTLDVSPKFPFCVKYNVFAQDVYK